MERIKPNKIKIIFEDNTRFDQYNETCKLEKQWYGETDDGQVIDIEMYYLICKEFAMAMGFAEKTINEWFGDY